MYMVLSYMLHISLIFKHTQKNFIIVIPMGWFMLCPLENIRSQISKVLSKQLWIWRILRFPYIIICKIVYPSGRGPVCLRKAKLILSQEGNFKYIRIFHMPTSKFVVLRRCLKISSYQYMQKHWPLWWVPFWTYLNNLCKCSFKRHMLNI